MAFSSPNSPIPCRPASSVRSLAAVLGEGRPDLIALLGAQDFGGADTVVALNAALMQDGVVIEVAPGVDVAEPIRVHAAVSSAPSARFSRSALVVGADATLRLAEASLARRTGAKRIIASLPPSGTMPNSPMPPCSPDGAGEPAIESLIAQVGAAPAATASR